MSKNDAGVPFAERMATILNHGALNLSLAIGYRLGLLDVMDRLAVPATAETIAEQAGLSPRYVREWLAVMACGGIVEMTSAAAEGENLFLLPASHGDLLTRRAGHANLGVYTQEIPLLTATVMEEVAGAFRHGEGINYEKYPSFHGFMSQLANAKHRRVLVSNFLPSIDDGVLVDRLRIGIEVCDLGCAEGVAATLMAEAFPQSRFTGVDISPEAIRQADKSAQEKHLSNLHFVRADAAELTSDPAWRARFDFVTAFDAIHDQGRPLDALRSIHAMLRPDGLFSMVDIAAGSRLEANLGHPMGAFLYTVSLMHCLPVGLAEGGAGLGMMWGRERALEMLAAAGFDRVSVHEIPDDAFNLNFLCRKPEKKKCHPQIKGNT